MLREVQSLQYFSMNFKKRFNNAFYNPNGKRAKYFLFTMQKLCGKIIELDDDYKYDIWDFDEWMLTEDKDEII